METKVTDVLHTTHLTNLNTKEKLRNRFKLFKTKKGLTIVELLIVLAIMAFIVAGVAGGSRSLFAKADSNNLKDEYHSFIGSIASIQPSGVSITPELSLDIPNNSINNFKFKVPNSMAFQTVNGSSVIRPNGGQTLTSVISINSLTLTLGAGFDATNATLSYPNGDTGKLPVSGAIPMKDLSLGGASGVPPMFLTNEESLLKDFFESPNGMNLLEFADVVPQLNGNADYAKVISLIFGGETDASILTQVNPFDTTATAIKPTIALTIVDQNLLANNENTNSLKILRNTNKGTLFVVTSKLSRSDFIALYSSTSPYTNYKDQLVPTGATQADTLGRLYDSLAQGFSLYTPVYIPRTSGNSIKSTSSDLKYGYYRP